MASATNRQPNRPRTARYQAGQPQGSCTDCPVVVIAGRPFSAGSAYEQVARTQRYERAGAFAIGAISGLLLIATGRIGRRQPVPFGPALAAGAVVGLLGGPGAVHLLWPGIA